MGSREASGCSSLGRMTEFWLRTKEVINDIKSKGTDHDEVFVSVDQIKKIGDRLKRNITKFGAAASTLKPHETEMAVGLMGEVETIWLALVATLEMVARTAQCNETLSKTIIANGDGLLMAITSMFKHTCVDKDAMVQATGQALEQIQKFMRTPVSNRSACHGALMQNLRFLRDCEKEMDSTVPESFEALENNNSDDASDFEDDDFDDLDCFDNCGPASEEEFIAIKNGAAIITASSAYLKAFLKALTTVSDNESRSLDARSRLDGLVKHWNEFQIAVDEFGCAFLAGYDIELAQETYETMLTEAYEKIRPKADSDVDAVLASIGGVSVVNKEGTALADAMISFGHSLSAIEK